MEVCNKEKWIGNFCVVEGMVSGVSIDTNLLDKEPKPLRYERRDPADKELLLTDEIFEEAVWDSINDTGIWTVEVLYGKIRDTDKHYASLMRKVYKEYLRKTVFDMKIHQDAFWSE